MRKSSVTPSSSALTAQKSEYFDYINRYYDSMQREKLSNKKKIEEAIKQQNQLESDVIFSNKVVNFSTKENCALPKAENNVVVRPSDPLPYTARDCCPQNNPVDANESRRPPETFARSEPQAADYYAAVPQPVSNAHFRPHETAPMSSHHRHELTIGGPHHAAMDETFYRFPPPPPPPPIHQRDPHYDATIDRNGIAPYRRTIRPCDCELYATAPRAQHHPVVHHPATRHERGDDYSQHEYSRLDHVAPPPIRQHSPPPYYRQSSYGHCHETPAAMRPPHPYDPNTIDLSRDRFRVALPNGDHVATRRGTIKNEWENSFNAARNERISNSKRNR